MPYIFLTVAIFTELIATSALNASSGFEKLWPSVLAICGYLVSFYFLALVLKEMPVGIVYAIWSGVGISVLPVIGYFYFNQTLDLAAITGIIMIVAGVLLMTLVSKSSIH